MKNACVMKQDSVPQWMAICTSENRKPLYHIPDLHSRYSGMILTITLKTEKIKHKKILLSYKYFVYA